jgi:hypothetical protein
MRCGTPGASGHVTAKPSIRKWGVLYKSAAYAPTVVRLTPGDLLSALERRVRQKLAEGGETRPDRSAGVSRGHSRWRITSCGEPRKSHTTEGPNG